MCKIIASSPQRAGAVLRPPFWQLPNQKKKQKIENKTKQILKKVEEEKNLVIKWNKFFSFLWRIRL